LARRYALIIMAFVFVSMAFGPHALAADPPQKSTTVIVVGVKGEIDGGQAALIRAALGEAQLKKADALLVEIDTFGGLVDAATAIRDMISETPIQTICYVKNRAWSAGALIAIAHKHIAIAPGGSIGAAEPIPTTEKTIAALKAEFAATANKSGRNPRVAEAMVDKTLGFEGYAQPGQILALTDYQAIKVGYADVVAADRAAVLTHFGLKDAQVVEYIPGWAEKFAGWLSDPTIKSILLGIIFLAVMTEIKTAGTGVAAMIGLVAAVLFFGSQWLTGLATWITVLLFLAGIVLIVVELYVPGMGIFGVAGLGCIFLSIFLTLGGNLSALNVMAVALVGAIILFLVILRYLPSSRLWNKLVLQTTEHTGAGFTSSKDFSHLIGAEGVTTTLLRPAGTVEIGGSLYDVVSEGRYIQPQTRITVIDVSGNRVVVRPLE